MYLLEYDKKENEPKSLKFNEIALLLQLINSNENTYSFMMSSIVPLLCLVLDYVNSCRWKPKKVNCFN